MSNQFLDQITQRRTIYAIGKNAEHTPEHLTDLIQTAIKQSPSSFNSQSSRAVILFNGESEKFWGLVADKLKSYAKDEESAAKTTAKMASFAAGVGTVLFFEDMDVVKGLQEQFPSYAENFPVWAEHSTAIAQFAVWTALADLGLGVNLQHYNPLIDDAVKAKFGVPASWKLIGQMPFGQPVQLPKPIEKMAIEDRVKVFPGND